MRRCPMRKQVPKEVPMTLPRRMATLLRMVLVVGLALPAGAMAEDDLGWHGNVHDGMATLFWGIPQSGYAEIAFSCHSGSQGAGFVFAFAPIHAVDGVEVTVTLEAGDIAIPIRTTGALMQMDDQFLLEGQVAIDAQLVALLDAPGLLSVFVEDGSVEYPLDGAREAAAALIAACGSGAATAGLATCAFDAWIEDSGPDALVIRDGPSGDAAAIGGMPGPYPGYDGTAYPTVSVTGASDGWFRIDGAVTNLYAPDDDVIVAFTGEGWVPGRALRLHVEGAALYDRPADDAAVAVDIGNGIDGALTVDRLYACHGPWAEVGGTYAGTRVRGWSNDTCESQITTCP